MKRIQSPKRASNSLKAAGKLWHGKISALKTSDKFFSRAYKNQNFSETCRFRYVPMADMPLSCYGVERSWRGEARVTIFFEAFRKPNFSMLGRTCLVCTADRPCPSYEMGGPWRVIVQQRFFSAPSESANIATRAVPASFPRLLGPCNVSEWKDLGAGAIEHWFSKRGSKFNFFQEGAHLALMHSREAAAKLWNGKNLASHISAHVFFSCRWEAILFQDLPRPPPSQNAKALIHVSKRRQRRTHAVSLVGERLGILAAQVGRSRG